MKDFLQITLNTGELNEDQLGILIALLDSIGYDSFQETEHSLIGYIEPALYKKEKLEEILLEYFPNHTIAFSSQELEKKNWNEEWEKNFQPVMVDDEIYIRAPFHPRMPEKTEITISPKMAFGTGHHATTFSVLQLLRHLEMKDVKLIDAGTGTGILAIFAVMSGADLVLAFDNDENAYVNCIENFELNQLPTAKIALGDVSLMKSLSADLVIANIHKNIILSDIPFYSNALPINGKLILSGFYSSDLPDVSERCEEFGLVLDKFLLKDDWVAALFSKKA